MDTACYILGSPKLHKRLCLAAEVLAHFLRNKHRTLRLEDIAKRVNCSRTVLLTLCRQLEQAALLTEAQTERDAWQLPYDRTSLSLWDIYCFVTSEESMQVVPGNIERSTDSIANRVEIQWMQAALTTNQSLANHLKQFMLDQILTRPTASISPRYSLPVMGRTPALHFEELSGSQIT